MKVPIVQLLTLCVPVSLAGAQQTRFVDPISPGPALNGMAWETAYHDIQDAIDTLQSLPGTHFILVAEGAYQPASATFNGSSVEHETYLVPASRVANLIIRGGYKGCDDQNCLSPGIDDTDDRDGDILATQLSGRDPSGEQSHHVLVVDGPGSIPGGATALTVVSGVRIEQGRADGNGLGFDSFGGGILGTEGCLILVEDCRIQSNEAKRGGGVYVNPGLGSTYFSRRNVYARNSAEHGGGLYAFKGPDVLFANDVFRNNGRINTPVNEALAPARKGGAIYLAEEATFDCANVIFDGNQSLFQGGAVYLVPATGQGDGTINAVLAHCTFYGNSTQNISGLHGTDVHVAGGRGTTPLGFDRNVLEVSNTITSNTETYGVSGQLLGVPVWREDWAPLGGAQDPVRVYIRNSLTSQAGVNALGALNTLFAANVFGNPQFVMPNLGNFLLDSGSPAIDAGSVSLIPMDLVDPDGNGVFDPQLLVDFVLLDRIRGNGPDMGAYER